MKARVESKSCVLDVEQDDPHYGGFVLYGYSRLEEWR